MPSPWHRQSGQTAWIMGVLNCTPDSFSDGHATLGNAALDVEAQVAKALLMVEQGASIIDVGGESTRPGAEPVSLAIELQRVIPVVEALTQAGVLVAVDSMKAEVMCQAVAAGAKMVNDVSALSYDAASLQVVAETGVDVCLMHMQGTPLIMQQKPCYTDVMADLLTFFAQRIQACIGAGIAESSLILDPGVGFGKRLEDNVSMIVNLQRLKAEFGLPVLLGTSRKSFLGLMTGAAVQDREVETAVTSAIGVFCGADMLRVHDCQTQHKAAQVASILADAAVVKPC